MAYVRSINLSHEDGEVTHYMERPPTPMRPSRRKRISHKKRKRKLTISNPYQINSKGKNSPPDQWEGRRLYPVVLPDLPEDCQVKMISVDPDFETPIREPRPRRPTRKPRRRDKRQLPPVVQPEVADDEMEGTPIVLSISPNKRDTKRTRRSPSRPRRGISRQRNSYAPGEYVWITPEKPEDNSLSITPRSWEEFIDLHPPNSTRVIYAKPFQYKEYKHPRPKDCSQEQALAASQLERVHQLNPALRTSGIAASTNNPFADLKEKPFVPANQFFHAGVEGADWKRSATFDNIASIEGLPEELDNLDLSALEDLGTSNEVQQILTMAEAPKGRLEPLPSSHPIKGEDKMNAEGTEIERSPVVSTSRKLPYALGDVFVTPQGGAVVIKDPVTGMTKPYPLVHQGTIPVLKVIKAPSKGISQVPKLYMQLGTMNPPVSLQGREPLKFLISLSIPKRKILCLTQGLLG